MATTRNYAADGRKADELHTDARTVRALEEEMTVMDATTLPTLDAGEYEVVSQSGSTYYVDAGRSGPSCDCPDWTGRQPQGGCKHIQRVLKETGKQPTDAVLLASLDVSRQFDGEHVSGAPLIIPPQRDFEYADAGTRALADGGVVDDVDPDCDDCGEDLACWHHYRAARSGGRR